MQALVLRDEGDPLYYGPWENPSPADGEVVVHLKAAALNHRDVFVTQGLYPGIRFPVILGSDGAGLVDGRAVIINPAMDWGDDPRAQSRRFHILGLPRNGTFAQQVTVPAEKIYDKPAHLTWEQAAAMPLAGMTAYRALFTRARLQPGERVLVSGIGGGVALFILQFARAVGADVWVTSGSADKISRAQTLGARGGVNYHDETWPDQLREQAGNFDVILDSAGGAGFAHFLKLCNPAARIVSYGGTLGAVPKLSPQVLFWKQISILGSTMATDEEFGAMVRFIDQHRIVPVVDSAYPLPEGQAAFDRMANGLQFGKITLTIPE